MRSELLKAAGLAMALTLAAGCAASRAFNQGERAARAGDYDTAVSYYSQAVQKDPTSATYKIRLERAQVTASHSHLEKAREYEEKGDLDDAAREYRKAAEFDPTNRNAAAKAVELEQKIRDKIEASRPKPQIEQIKERARQTAPEPLLNPASRQPLKINFAQGIKLKQVLDFIGQTSGINVMYESTFQDQDTKSATDLDGVTLEQALTLVLTANNLFYKILNGKTILIIPDTPANRQKYEDQVIRTFYLSHADATEMLTMLNGILIGQGVQQSRPAIQINKSANSITIRASASMVAIAEQIVERNDKPRAEVVIDVEILEVDRTRVKQYGLNLSNYQIGVQFSPEGPPASTERHRNDHGHDCDHDDDDRRDVQPQHDLARHQYVGFLPVGSVGRGQVPRVGLPDETHRQALASRRGGHQADRQPRRRDPRAVDHVLPDHHRRHRHQPDDLVQLPAGRCQPRGDPPCHLRRRCHSGPLT